MPYRDSEKRKAYILDYMKRGRAKMRALIDEAKKVPCADCGKSFLPRAMDFHHVSGEKVDKISSFTSNHSSAGPKAMAALEAELLKCVVLCAVCHRLRH